MTTPSSIVLANKFSSTDIGHARSQLLQTEFAADLSTALNCSVDVLYIKTIEDTDKRLVLSEQEKANLISKSRDAYSSIMNDFPHPGRLKIKFGTPALEISKTIREDNSVEALIMGSPEAKSFFEELIQGDLPLTVLENISRPVFIFGKKAVENSYRLPVNRKINILLASDLSREIRALETYIVSLAKRLNAKVTLFHKIDFNTPLTTIAAGVPTINYVPEFNYAELEQLTLERIENRLKRMKEVGVECDFILDSSVEPFEESLIDTSFLGYDFLAIGNRKKKFFQSWSGNKLQKIYNEVPMPVISLRTNFYS